MEKYMMALDQGTTCLLYTSQAYTDQWWPPVKNCEDWAGAGDNEAIRYLGICVSKGCIRGRVYTEKNGWLPYITFRSEYDIADTENGVLGDGSPIQAVQLYYICLLYTSHMRISVIISLWN